MQIKYTNALLLFTLLLTGSCFVSAAEICAKKMEPPHSHSNENTMDLVTIDSSNPQILREPAKEVKFPLDAKTKKFIENFRNFFTALRGPMDRPPAGLAAPQVGTSLRIFMMQIPPEAKQFRKDVYETVPPTLLINPSYTPVEKCGKIKDWEGCFSVPDKVGEIYRYKVINYEGYTVDGKKITGTAKGLLARIIQHEMGHLNGELYVDHLSPDSHFGDIESMTKIRSNTESSTPNYSDEK